MEFQGREMLLFATLFHAYNRRPLGPLFTLWFVSYGMSPALVIATSHITKVVCEPWPGHLCVVKCLSMRMTQSSVPSCQTQAEKKTENQQVLGLC